MRKMKRSIKTLVRAWMELIGWLMLGAAASLYACAIVNQYIGWLNYIGR